MWPKISRYDSYCVLFGYTFHNSLQPIRTRAASGRSIARQFGIEIQVLDRNATKELIPWHVIHFRGQLEGHLFNQPHRQRLYIAHSWGYLNYNLTAFVELSGKNRSSLGWKL